VAISSGLAKCLWDRIIPHLRQEELNDIRPFGISGKGKWFAECVNPYFRFTKYNEGHFFKKHQDGGYVNNNNQRSILTLMIYLNDNFEGGATTFYEDGDNMEVIKPVNCTGVIFNHDVEHEGDVIIKGTKYILRTDIMFYRINYIDKDDDYTKTEEWIQSEELYKKSVTLQNEGKPRESTEAYLEAQAIMTKHKTYKSLINRNFANCLLGNKEGSSILKNILSYLIIIPHELKEFNYSNDPDDKNEGKCVHSSDFFRQQLANLLSYRLVMRSWDQYITSNTIWKQLIKNKWGSSYPINTYKFPNDRRLFEIYKMRTFLKIKKNPLLLIDFGYNHVRYMFNNKTKTYLKDENVFLEEYRHNTAGICNSSFFKSCGHRWGWDSGYAYWIGNSSIQRYTADNSTDYSGNLTAQKIWTDKEFNLKAACSLIAALDNMIYYSRGTQTLVCLPYYLITPNNKQRILKEDIKQCYIRALIPREIIVFNYYEVDTGILIYLDGESGSLTLIEKGLLVDRLSIRLYESDKNLKTSVKLKVRKIKDEKFYVNELIILSENKEKSLDILNMLEEFKFKVTHETLNKLFECFNKTFSQRLFYEDIMSYFEI
jgi:hypothetical protein